MRHCAYFGGSGTIPENVGQIDDMGRLELQSIAETVSPWKPAETAPKDGRPFIAYDRHIQLVETAHWDKQARKFLNEVGDEEVKFTEWLDRPA